MMAQPGLMEQVLMKVEVEERARRAREGQQAAGVRRKGGPKMRLPWKRREVARPYWGEPRPVPEEIAQLERRLASVQRDLTRERREIGDLKEALRHAEQREALLASRVRDQQDEYEVLVDSVEELLSGLSEEPLMRTARALLRVERMALGLRKEQIESSVPA